MLRGGKIMKYLKIEDNKVYFRTDNNIEWKGIDQIDKDDLLELTFLAVEKEFEMDEYIKESIGNQAHQIIYKNIYDKFFELIGNKSRFSDESDSLYKNAFEKYSNEIEV